MTETEVWVSADTMIKAHGNSAAMEADHMAHKMRARRDGVGDENWRHIATAIRMLDRGCFDAN